MSLGQVCRLGIAACALLLILGCAGRATAPASVETTSAKASEGRRSPPLGAEPSTEQGTQAEPSTEQGTQAEPSTEQETQVEPSTEQPARTEGTPSRDLPQRELPIREEAATSGLQIQLDDGSYFIIPYGDEGLDQCSMVHVARNGERTPHRPPDVQAKCATRWREK